MANLSLRSRFLGEVSALSWFILTCSHLSGHKHCLTYLYLSCTSQSYAKIRKCINYRFPNLPLTSPAYKTTLLGYRMIWMLVPCLLFEPYGSEKWWLMFSQQETNKAKIRFNIRPLHRACNNFVLIVQGASSSIILISKQRRRDSFFNIQPVSTLFSPHHNKNNNDEPWRLVSNKLLWSSISECVYVGLQISGMRSVCSDEELVKLLCDRLHKACQETGRLSSFLSNQSCSSRLVY